jgi:SP family galactose:H+ symporter-like MFS transporter
MTILASQSAGSLAPGAAAIPTPTEKVAERDALVAALIELSPYRAALRPLEADIARIARANRQIGAALAAIEARTDFGRTGRLRRADLGPECTALLGFLEYIRFASPDFLRSVGEWPVGDRA